MRLPDSYRVKGSLIMLTAGGYCQVGVAAGRLFQWPILPTIIGIGFRQISSAMPFDLTTVARHQTYRRQAFEDLPEVDDRRWGPL